MGLGPPEIIGILVLALLLFGPRKLPELGRGLGQGLREFRRGTREVRADLNELHDPAPLPAAPRRESEVTP